MGESAHWPRCASRAGALADVSGKVVHVQDGYFQCFTQEATACSWTVRPKRAIRPS
jgi:hypothetical protein